MTDLDARRLHETTAETAARRAVGAARATERLAAVPSPRGRSHGSFRTTADSRHGTHPGAPGGAGMQLALHDRVEAFHLAVGLVNEETA